MNEFIIIYYNAASLLALAGQAAKEAPDLVVTSEQIKQYAKHIAANAMKIGSKVVLKVKAHSLPAPYFDNAEEVFIVQTDGRVKSFKNKRTGSIMVDIALEASLVKYGFMTLHATENTPELQK